MAEYRDEDVARLRRILALRAITADGMSQREVAESLGISQQFKAARDLTEVHPNVSRCCRAQTSRKDQRYAQAWSVVLSPDTLS